MTKEFEINLRTHLEQDPALRRRGKRILSILDETPSARRTRLIDRMERHATSHFGDGKKGIDWSKIDWNKLIEGLLKLLMTLLPLLLAKEDKK